jgi:hypothetical protein
MTIPTQASVAAQVRRRIETQHPYATCDECLSKQLLAPIDEVRASALTVARFDGFMRRVRVCYACNRGLELTSRE